MALDGHVEEKRSIRRQRKIWLDNVREDLKEKNIDLTRIGEATRNREFWRSLVRATSSFVSTLMVERKEVQCTYCPNAGYTEKNAFIVANSIIII